MPYWIARVRSRVATSKKFSSPSYTSLQRDKRYDQAKQLSIHPRDSLASDEERKSVLIVLLNDSIISRINRCKLSEKLSDAAHTNVSQGESQLSTSPLFVMSTNRTRRPDMGTGDDGWKHSIISLTIFIVFVGSLTACVRFLYRRIQNRLSFGHYSSFVHSHTESYCDRPPPYACDPNPPPPYSSKPSSPEP